MSKLWHYRILGEEFGPVEEQTLRSLIDDGTIGPADDVRSVDDATWKRADTLKADDRVDSPSASEMDAMLAGPSQDSAASSAGEDTAGIDLDSMLAPSTPRGSRKAKADDWYYRVSGQRHGPFDFDTLFEHAAEGKLSRYDEIREPGQSDWVEAQTIVGLFPDDSAELDAMLSSAEMDSQPSASARKPKKKTPRWYYRVLNQELGPVDFEGLFDLVVEGNLRADDEIRGEEETNWSRADSMVGLFPDDVSPAAAVDFEPEPVEDDDDDAEWYMRVNGQESGPVTFGRLTRMAASGKLERTNEIRLTKLGAWMEADSMVGLFPEPEAPAEPKVTAPPPASVSTVPDRPAGDADDWAAAVLSEPTAEPPPTAAPSPREPEPASQVPVSSPVAAATPPPSAPPKPPAQVKRPAFTSPPKTKSSGGGGGLSLPPGLTNAFTDPKVLIGVGVVILAVGLYFVPWGSLFGAGAEDLIAQLEVIWPEVKAVYEQEGDDAAWAALSAKVGPQLQEIAETATDRGAGPSSPGLQIAYTLAATQIPKILQKKQAATANEIKIVDNFLFRAHEL